MDTWFWPVIQAGVLGIKEEEAALGKVFNAVRRVYEVPAPAVMEEKSQSEDGETRQPPTPVETDKVTVDLTSGYFGLYKAYKRVVIDSPVPVRVIAASPKVCPSSCVLHWIGKLTSLPGEWVLWIRWSISIDSRRVHITGESVLE